MPATVTFLSITPKLAIPLRVFVHRKQVLAENQISVNEKSILTVSATASIRLSNYDLNNLCQDLHTQIEDILLRAPLHQLFPKKSAARSSVSVQEISNAWKCKVVVSLGYIVDLRYSLGGNFSSADVTFLDSHGIEVSASVHGSTSLLERSFRFSFMENEDDNSLISLDDKKQIKYSLKTRQLLNNKLTDPLLIYVLSRPRS